MRMMRRAGLLGGGETAVGTWYFNQNIAISAMPSASYSVNFVSNSNSYTSITFADAYYWMMYYDNTTACTVSTRTGSTSWQNNNYRTIQITGGADANNPDLLTWLQANATKIA